MPYCAACSYYGSSADLRRTPSGWKCKNAKSCALRVVAVQELAKRKVSA